MGYCGTGNFLLAEYNNSSLYPSNRLSSGIVVSLRAIVSRIYSIKFTDVISDCIRITLT